MGVNKKRHSELSEESHKIKVKCPAKTTSTLDEQMRHPELVSGSHGLRVKCPAKINLTLEILNKREDGFHNIQSVMQTIDLFDILTIKVERSDKFEIKLSGTSNEIPYDEKNLIHKAIVLFMDSVISSSTPVGKNRGEKAHYKISIHIEKNIPVAAGLAGGSTDAAGTLWGLNKIFNNILSEEQLHPLCAKLGSDLNFCIKGGCQLATSRGEILKKLLFQEFNVSLIKPKSLGISAKEAYTKFSQLANKPNLNMTEKFINSSDSHNIETLLHNDLEVAIINDYEELQQIKKAYPSSIMSGSGSTFFVINQKFKNLDNNFWVKNDLKSISYGVSEI